MATTQIDDLQMLATSVAEFAIKPTIVDPDLIVRNLQNSFVTTTNTNVIYEIQNDHYDAILSLEGEDWADLQAYYEDKATQIASSRHRNRRKGYRKNNRSRERSKNNYRRSSGKY